MDTQQAQQKVSTISGELARFVTGFDGASLPAEVRRRAKLLMLDAIGIAFASTRFQFARGALDALREFGKGDCEVIGVADRLALRDAVLMNAILVHGLDYDDTYLPSRESTSRPSVQAVSNSAPVTPRWPPMPSATGTQLAVRCTEPGRYVSS